MDQWKPTSGFTHQSVTEADSDMPPQPPPSSEPSQRQEGEMKNPISARKVQKADREKLRRGRLKEQFLELANKLDPDRPKIDKATILRDTIQVLKDLTAEVNRLKADCAALSEESRELTQEKNELREEKACLKSDIENLNVQYQQRLRVMFPWTAVEPPVVMAPPYSYPVPVPVPPGAITMNPSMHLYPFFGHQNPSAMPSHCSTFIPYPSPVNPPNEQPSVPYASASHVSSKQDSRSRSTDHQSGSSITERCDHSNEVATDLELKMPGSSTQQDQSTDGRQGKQSQRKGRNISDGSSSTTYSSSHALQDSSSKSVGDVPKSKK